MRNTLFQDRNVREALTRLIDRRSILKNLFYDLGQITTGPFYIFSKAYDKTVQPYEHNEKIAIELLQKAGWSDKNNNGILTKNGVAFRFTFLIPHGSTEAEQIGTIIKENFKKVGIIMDIKQLEWAAFLQQIDDRKFDAVTLGWSLTVEDDPYQLWHSSQIQKGSNYVGFANKRVDELIEKARMEFNEDKRNEMFKEIHHIIHYEQPYTFLFCTMGLEAIDKRFQNTKTYNIFPGMDMTEWWVPLNMQKYKEKI